jgi:hypothetical protein
VTGAIHRSTDGGTTWGFAFEPATGSGATWRSGPRTPRRAPLLCVGQHDGGVIWRSSIAGRPAEAGLALERADWQKCGGRPGRGGHLAAQTRTVYVAVTRPR